MPYTVESAVGVTRTDVAFLSCNVNPATPASLAAPHDHESVTGSPGCTVSGVQEIPRITSGVKVVVFPPPKPVAYPKRAHVLSKNEFGKNESTPEAQGRLVQSSPRRLPPTAPKKLETLFPSPARPDEERRLPSTVVVGLPEEVDDVELLPLALVELDPEALVLPLEEVDEEELEEVDELPPHSPKIRAIGSHSPPELLPVLLDAEVDDPPPKRGSMPPIIPWSICEMIGEICGPTF